MAKKEVQEITEQQQVAQESQSQEQAQTQDKSIQLLKEALNLNDQPTMSKKEFWIRLSIYVFFGAIVPFIFIALRFEIFKPSSSKVSLGGWGIIGLIIAAVFFLKMLKQVKKGLPYSLFSQIITGLCRVTIPLIIGAFIAYYFQDLMDYVFQVLCVLIFCETVAIVVNPIPKWAHDNKLERQSGMLTKIISFFKDDEGGSK